MEWMDAGRIGVRCWEWEWGPACMVGWQHLLYMSLKAAISFFAAMIFCWLDMFPSFTAAEPLLLCGDPASLSPRCSRNPHSLLCPFSG